MFVIKKIVKPFLWPPGLFILVFIAASLWQIARGRRRASLFCLLTAVLMWLAAITPTADLLLRPLEARYPLPAALDGDVILVLGGALYAGAPDIDGVGAPNAEACERLLAAARLHRRTGLPIILSGGRVHPHQELMGPVYQRFLKGIGVAPEKIILENRSRDTFENARYSWAICRQKGYRRPLVVTHAAHMPRAMFCFHRLNVPATPVPCGFRTWVGKTYHWPDFLPRSFNGLAGALHEYIGLLAYRWQYRSSSAS
ncbi:MAG: YdcF family protein [Desulfobacterales bacterium]|jgi:uncharacterized SAM-binding protein YcdF (DUF218 family)